MQNRKPDYTDSRVERNGVDGDTAVRKVGGWAGATYAWAVTRSRRRRCGNRDERDAPGSNSAFTRHGIDAQRRRVLQRHMRVARAAVGGWAEAVYAYAWRILKRLGAKNTRSLSF